MHVDSHVRANFWSAKALDSIGPDGLIGHIIY